MCPIHTVQIVWLFPEVAGGCLPCSLYFIKGIVALVMGSFCELVTNLWRSLQLFTTVLQSHSSSGTCFFSTSLKSRTLALFVLHGRWHNISAISKQASQSKYLWCIIIKRWIICEMLWSESTPITVTTTILEETPETTGAETYQLPDKWGSDCCQAKDSQ